MNAVAVTSSSVSATPAPAHGLAATVSVGGIEPLEATVVHFGRRAVVIQTDGVLERGAHAWVSVTLPGGDEVRPLVQIVGDTTDGLACRIIHVFPNDNKMLENYRATKATPAGYSSART
ncbi:MAG: hypothetical protein ACI9MR_000290 [Myxococcota bacterium]|jgi:hypothetical protein